MDHWKAKPLSRSLGSWDLRDREASGWAYSDVTAPFHRDRLQKTAKASGQQRVQGTVLLVTQWSLGHIGTHLYTVQGAAAGQSLTLRMWLTHFNVETMCLRRLLRGGGRRGKKEITSLLSKGTGESWLHILPSLFLVSPIVPLVRKWKEEENSCKEKEVRRPLS